MAGPHAFTFDSAAAPPLSSLTISETKAENGGRAFAFVNAGTIHNFNVEDPEEARKKALQRCKDALFVNFPEVDRKELENSKGKRVMNTCEWILDNTIYEAWINGNTPVLWIRGGPGKGKTMLAIFLTEKLAQRLQYRDLETHPHVIYWFCRYKAKRRNDARDVIRGLLWQIVMKHAEMTEYLLPYFDTPEKSEFSLSSFEVLWTLFEKMVRDPSLNLTFCVLDGLDECDDESQSLLSSRISELASTCTQSTNSAFQMVVLGRNAPKSNNINVLNLDPDNNERINRDIEIFVSDKTAGLSQLEGASEEFLAVVQQELMLRSEGTFLWIGFAANELLQKSTCTEVLDTLRSLPRGLHEIYGRMLLKIAADRRSIVSNLLQWVALAQRSLYINELANTMSIPEATPITAQQTVRDYVSLCWPLLEIREGQVSFVHQSASDYLLREEPDPNLELESFRINKEESHLKIAQACFAILRENEGAESLESEACPALLYAGLHWGHHMMQAGSLNRTLLQSESSFFDAKQSSLRDWWWARTRASSSYAREGPIEPTPLHLACFIGSVPWVTLWLAQNPFRVFTPVALGSFSWSWWINMPSGRDSKGNTPLHYAAYGGYDAVGRLILALNIEQKLPAQSWHRYLLHAVDENHATALHVACNTGRTTMVQLLLDQCSADVNRRTKDGNTPLYLASARGYYAIVRILLEHGAIVDVKNLKDETPLQAASDLGQTEVVQILLESCKHLDWRDATGNAALHYASMRGENAVVKLLLDAGADINIGSKADGKGTNPSNTTPLGSASQDGHLSTVRLLLKHAADCDAGKSTPLAVALRRAHYEIAALLLDHGADVNASGTDNVPPLAITCRGRTTSKEQLSLATRILSLGAEVNAKGEAGYTALHKAAYFRPEGVVALLLAHDADVHARDMDGGSPLHSAVQGPAPFRKETIELLLDRGADVNAKDYRDQTPLHKAAMSTDCQDTILLLIRKGGDVHAKDCQNQTPLDIARRWKHDVSLLLNIED